MQMRPISLARFAAVAGMVGILSVPVTAFAAAGADAGEDVAPVAQQEAFEQADGGIAQPSPNLEMPGADGEVESGESIDAAPEDTPATEDTADEPDDAPSGSGAATPVDAAVADDEGDLADATPSALQVVQVAGQAASGTEPASNPAEPRGINVSASVARVGVPVTVSAAFGEGDTQGCTYNYVWAKADWSDWGSTVRDQGGYTADASWEFCPTQTGSYILAVDVVRDGKVQTFSTTIEVRVAWNAAGLVVKASSPSAGSPFEVAVAFEDGSVTEGLSYNYVWMKNNWASWGSTKKDGLEVHDSSRSYTLQSPGSYTLYVDVTDASGKSVTLSCDVKVGAAGYGLNVSLYDGAAVMAPAVPAGAEGLKFNYVWQLNGSWADGDWGSTVLQTGGPTSDTMWSVPLTCSGTYTLYLDIIGPDGLITTLSRTVNSDGSATFSDISASSESGSFTVGSQIDVSLSASVAEPGRYKYNVVWAREDWSAWASTITETGTHSVTAELQFVPTKPGKYLLYVDVVDTKTGETKTLSSSVDVSLGWSVTGLDVSYAGVLTPTSTVVLKPQVQGDATGLTYNYVWQGNGWSNWNSTVRQTGSPSTSATGSVALNGTAGFYGFYVDVTDEFGNTVTYGPQTLYASYKTIPVERIYEVASTQFGGFSPEPFESAVLATGAPLCYGETGYFCGAFVWWSMTQAGYGDKYCDGNVIVEPRLALRYYEARGLYDPDIRNVRAGDIVLMRFTRNTDEYPADHIAYCLWADSDGYMVMEANNGPCGARYYRYDHYASAGFARILY